MRRPVVFIGSSSEKLELAQKVELWIEEAGCEPVLWSGSFEAGDFAAPKLVEHAKSAAGAVMIFGDDDTSVVRKKHLVSPRDNVVFELGLFIGAASDNAFKRAIVLRVGDTDVLSDLDGMTFVQVDPTGANASKVKSGVKDFAKRLLAMEAQPKLDIFQITAKKELFVAGTKLLGESGERVTLAAKTPVPIMGCRPYNRVGQPHWYEEEQYKLYWDLAEAASGGRAELTLLASVPGMVEDLNDCRKDEFHSCVKDNLKRLLSLTKKPKSKVRVFWHEGLSPPAFLVAGDSSLLWWKGSNGDAVWIRHQSRDLAQALTGQKNTELREYEFDQIMTKLPLET